MAETKLVLGARVRFLHRGERKTGTIVAIVPADKTPGASVPNEIWEDRTTKLLGDVNSLQAREHVSYLIEMPVGVKSLMCLVWPAAESVIVQNS